MTEPVRPASNTAWAVMVLRAAHQLIDAKPPILDDPIAPRLLDAESRAGIRDHPEHFALDSTRLIRAHVVIRSRYAEDRLAEAVRRGTVQFVILGAGYDTFACRQPAWASALRIFEVDHPASQQAKRERLAVAEVQVPSNVVFAPVDFEHETLIDGLRLSGFDPALPTFVSCLGVLVYLTADAAEGVFRFAAALLPTSEITCTFRTKSDTESRVGAAAAAAGEPWLSQFDPAELDRTLRAMGFAEITFIGGAELEVRYALRRPDGLHPSRRMSLVSAVV